MDIIVSACVRSTRDDCVQRSIVFIDNSPFVINTSQQGLLCIQSDNCKSRDSLAQGWPTFLLQRGPFNWFFNMGRAALLSLLNMGRSALLNRSPYSNIQYSPLFLACLYFE